MKLWFGLHQSNPDESKEIECSFLAGVAHAFESACELHLVTINALRRRIPTDGHRSLCDSREERVLRWISTERIICSMRGNGLLMKSPQQRASRLLHLFRVVRH